MTYQKTHMVFVLILSIILLVSTAMIDSSIEKNPYLCNSKTLQNTNKGILVIGSVLLTFSSTFIFLGSNDLNISKNKILVLTSCLALILIVLGSIVINEQKENVCKDGKTAGIIVLVAGLTLFLPSLGMIIYYKKETLKGGFYSVKRKITNKMPTISRHSTSRLKYY